MSPPCSWKWQWFYFIKILQKWSVVSNLLFKIKNKEWWYFLGKEIFLTGLREAPNTPTKLFLGNKIFLTSLSLQNIFTGSAKLRKRRLSQHTHFRFFVNISYSIHDRIKYNFYLCCYWHIMAVRPTLPPSPPKQSLSLQFFVCPFHFDSFFSIQI